jgi:hypothetical protein
MLSPEDRVECASHLPKSDLKTMPTSLEEQSAMEDTIAVDTLGVALVDGFFENNAALQDDMRTFQVHPLCQRHILICRRIYQRAAFRLHFWRMLRLPDDGDYEEISTSGRFLRV